MYGYDHANHLILAEKWTEDPDVMGTPVLQMHAEYRYDAYGNRIEKNVDDDGSGSNPTVVTRFAIDGWNPAKASPIGNENNDVFADLDYTSSFPRSHAPRGNDSQDAPRRGPYLAQSTSVCYDRRNSTSQPHGMPAMTRSRYRVYENQFPYFLTFTIVGWLPIFTRPDTAQIIFDSWQFLHDQSRMQIYGYVILENHLHLIAAADDLSKEIGDFKSFTARCLIDFLEQRNLQTLLKQLQFHKEKHKTDRDYQVWQEGSHPQQIQNDEIMLQKLEYMHRNPVARGYVDEPVHWRWSSARNFARLEAVYAPVQTDWR